MKLYRVTYRDDGDSQLAIWTTSKAKANKIIAEVKRDNELWRGKQSEITYDVVTFDTDKRGLVAMLNQWAYNSGQ